MERCQCLGLGHTEPPFHCRAPARWYIGQAAPPATSWADCARSMSNNAMLWQSHAFIGAPAPRERSARSREGSGHSGRERVMVSPTAHGHPHACAF